MSVAPRICGKANTYPKYGDYVVLRPNQPSCDQLSKLAATTKNLVINQANLHKTEVQENSADKMHLTLAMPLNPMTRDRALDLINFIRSGESSSPYQFDLVFRGKESGGSEGFSFTSPNFAPGFDIRFKDPNKAYNGHNSQNPYTRLCSIASKVQGYCILNQMVDLNKNEDGKCNPFFPHITLGKLTNAAACKTLHNRVQHTPGAPSLSHLANVNAANQFLCTEIGHRHCNTLPLQFEKIEILRVDAADGEPGKSYCLASLDLKTNQIFLANFFPECVHNRPESQPNTQSSYLPSFLAQPQYSQTTLAAPRLHLYPADTTLAQPAVQKSNSFEVLSQVRKKVDELLGHNNGNYRLFVDEDLSDLIVLFDRYEDASRLALHNGDYNCKKKYANWYNGKHGVSFEDLNKVFPSQKEKDILIQVKQEISFLNDPFLIALADQRKPLHNGNVLGILRKEIWSHLPNRPYSDNYDYMNDFEFRYGTDQLSNFVIDVCFKDKDLAIEFLRCVEPENTGKVHEKEGRYIVKLGKRRLNHMHIFSGQSQVKAEDIFNNAKLIL